MIKSKKKILITGANNGLGYDLIKELLKDNKFKLIAIINKNKPNKILSKKIESISMDLFDKKNILSFKDKFKKHKIDTVIHCAGGGLGFRENDLQLEKLEKLMQLNFYSIFELNKILIMNKKRGQRLNIIHIGSLAANQSTASIGYSATKASLISYNKNLAYKYFNNKIYTKLLIPGSFLSTNGSMQRLKIEKNKIFKKIENKLISKKMLKSKNIIPVIKFLFTKDSDILTGSIVSASNLESLSNYS